jgi:hypothetical protein
MPRRDKWKGQTGYWKSLSTGVTAILLGGVFFLFAPMDLMAGIMGVDSTTVGQALVQAGVAGGFAGGYAFAGFPLQFAGVSLEEITRRLRATSLERGPQRDDQTVLLVRRSPEAGADRATA